MATDNRYDSPVWKTEGSFSMFFTLKFDFAQRLAVVWTDE